MRRFTEWLFANPQGSGSLWSVIAWWEVRRIPFNAIVGTYGALCLLVFFWAIVTSGHLAPGEDAIEPIAMLATPVAINLLYTFGWLVEVPARTFKPDLSPRFGPVLLKLGLGFSVFLITIPALLWVGYRLLQLAGIAS